MKRALRSAAPLLAAALAAAALTAPATPARAGGLTYVASFGSFGSGSGQFIQPLGVAVSGGLVYVADTANDRIDRFDPANFAASFTSFGSLGSGRGQFNAPFGLAVSGGLVYVADTNNDRIDRFDPTNFAASFTSFGSPGSGIGQFTIPSGVAVDGSGSVFVADSGNNRIVQLASVVPEPSSLALVAIGSLAILVACGMQRRAGRVA